MADFIPFSPPSIGEEEIAAVAETMRSGWMTLGPKTKQFEDEFKSYVNAPATLALAHCTGALHVALKTLGIKSGDEVITTPMTFTATANVVELLGAKPVFVDVEPDTLNIDPTKIEAKITKNTKAILPVHYAGHPADMDKIDRLGAVHNIPIVEDAAHSIPASISGKKIGSSKNLTAFSFYATKNLTTGEGGMLTGDQTLIDKARTLSMHGMNRDAWKRYDKSGSWFYEVVDAGFKYNMTDIQASIGLVQLKKMASFQQRRNEIVSRYKEEFKSLSALVMPTKRENVEHAWHLFVLRLNPKAIKINRNQFIDELKELGIATSVHFIPLHLHPYYRDKYGFKPLDYPIAYENYQNFLSLPLHPKLSDSDQQRIIESVKTIVKKYT